MSHTSATGMLKWRAIKMKDLTPKVGDLFTRYGYEDCVVLAMGSCLEKTTEKHRCRVHRSYVVMRNLGNNQLRTVWQEYFERHWEKS